ncbi:hypothetical protein ACFQY7_28350 [Actinomadura luteofluorescens]|uniref:hypothetical protein n=1 Tax=Actinomadura luteofluorescens TaxID=46163 RepID=UPI003643837C
MVVVRGGPQQLALHVVGWLELRARRLAGQVAVLVAQLLPRRGRAADLRGRPSPSATCRTNQAGSRASIGRAAGTPRAGASTASHQRLSGQLSAMSPNRTVMKCW